MLGKACQHVAWWLIVFCTQSSPEDPRAAPEQPQSSPRAAQSSSKQPQSTPEQAPEMPQSTPAGGGESKKKPAMSISVSSTSRTRRSKRKPAVSISVVEHQQGDKNRQPALPASGFCKGRYILQFASLSFSGLRSVNRISRILEASPSATCSPFPGLQLRRN